MTSNYPIAASAGFTLDLDLELTRSNHQNNVTGFSLVVRAGNYSETLDCVLKFPSLSHDWEEGQKEVPEAVVNYFVCAAKRAGFLL